MEIDNEFDEIRPFNQEELPVILEKLIADEYFQKVMVGVFPTLPFEFIVQRMRSCKTIKEFQKAFSYTLIKEIIQKYSDGVTLDLSLLEDKTLPYTYISNHRDIILDSGFLSVLLLDEELDTVEIAIGDNLLVYPWIKDLVRLNKSFLVQRGLTIRQILESSARMSRYIHHAITYKKESIWLSQREGRAKDSSDQTQDSILKMLAMGGEGDIVDRLKELRIAPLTLSYEYDPCDYLKAQEYQQKRDFEEFKKSPKDDLTNMKMGLYGYKGRVHLQVTPCINDKLDQLDRDVPKNVLFSQISALIDLAIHQHYRIYPCNYIACDLISATTEFKAHYTDEELAHFENYLTQQLDKIQLEEKDTPFLRNKMLQMYANPLRNYLTAIQ